MAEGQPSNLQPFVSQLQGQRSQEDPIGEQAQKMNCTYNLLDKWNTSFRNYYVKLTKSMSGQATEHMADGQCWVINNNVLFKPYIRKAHATTSRIAGLTDSYSDDANLSGGSQSGKGSQSQFLDDTNFQQRPKKKRQSPVQLSQVTQQKQS